MMPGFAETFLKAMQRRRARTRPVKTIAQHLIEFRRDIANIRDLQELASLPGWNKLVGVLKGRRDELQQGINALVTQSPTKNADQLRSLNAFREAIDLFLGVFDSTLAAEDELVKAKEKLEEMQRQQTDEAKKLFG